MQPDWHSADIIAALKKQGTSMAALSSKAGLASSTLANALNRHWPKGERLIADALGVAPDLISMVNPLPAQTSEIAGSQNNCERGHPSPRQFTGYPAGKHSGNSCTC